MDIAWRSTSVPASDGTRLAVFTAGRADGPPVLLLHGYPDDHRVWDAVAAHLADSMRLIAFDVRGAGASGRPDQVEGYRLAQLARDLDTVAASVGAPVHLVGHDWGSVQAWYALTRPGARERYASFTSISGPSLAYTSDWSRRSLRAGWAGRRSVLRQAGASWYVGLFLVPWLPELLWRTGVLTRALGAHGRHVDRRSALDGLALYRANIRAGGGAPRPGAVPTLVLAPRHDRYITPATAMQAPAPWTPHLQTQIIDGGHWTFVDHPERVAVPLRAFVCGVADTPDLPH